jgi:hypothetical protein
MFVHGQPGFVVLMVFPSKEGVAVHKKHAVQAKIPCSELFLCLGFAARICLAKASFFVCDIKVRSAYCSL